MDTLALKKLRCSKGYFTQADMARAVGMRPSNYRNRENGKVRLSADELVVFCEVLGLSIEDGIQMFLS